MAKIWAERIIASTRRLEDVPARYKDEVIKILREKMGEEWLENYLNPPEEMTPPEEE